MPEISFEQMYVNIFNAMKAFARAKVPDALVTSVQFTMTPSEVGIDLEGTNRVVWAARVKLDCKNDPHNDFYCLQRSWASGGKDSPLEAFQALSKVLDTEFRQYVSDLITEHDAAMRAAQRAADALSNTAESDSSDDLSVIWPSPEKQAAKEEGVGVVVQEDRSDETA